MERRSSTLPFRGLTLWLEYLDECDADEQGRHAAEPQARDLALGQAEPAVPVDEPAAGRF